MPETHSAGLNISQPYLLGAVRAQSVTASVVHEDEIFVTKHSASAPLAHRPAALFSKHIKLQSNFIHMPVLLPQAHFPGVVAQSKTPRKLQTALQSTYNLFL